MKYIKIHITLSKHDPFVDMLTYSLGDEGAFDSFEETDDGIDAYVPADSYDERCVEEALNELRAVDDTLQCSFSAEDMPDKDYNEEWERSRGDVLVDGCCLVRGPLSPTVEGVKYDIVIDTQMSFGTAHHPTTYLMLSAIMTEDVVGKNVLDMGCGTAVLAIMAARCWAAYVEAIDIDEWSFRVAQSNAQLNGVNLNVKLGDAHAISADRKFDMVLANINRNILVRDMQLYVSAMASTGVLLVSGFYEDDVPLLCHEAESCGLLYVSKQVRDTWCMIKFEKK